MNNFADKYITTALNFIKNNIMNIVKILNENKIHSFGDTSIKEKIENKYLKYKNSKSQRSLLLQRKYRGATHM